MASTCVDRGRGLPSFLPLARTGLMDSTRLLDHLWQQKSRLSRLMVATQQVGENDMRVVQQGRLDAVWLTESGGYNLCQNQLWLILSYKLFLSKRDIEPTTKSTMAVRPKRIDWPTISTSNPPIRVTLIMWGSMPLITLSTTVITVLHYAEVVHILHESRLSLVARHPLIRWNTFTHFSGCALGYYYKAFQWL
jgi:hypothetical protein